MNNEMEKAVWDEKYHLYQKKFYKCRLECGWSGLGSAAEHGESFRDLFELLCPKCHEKLGLVIFPTLDEAMENLAQYSPLDKMGFLLAKVDQDKKE